MSTTSAARNEYRLEPTDEEAITRRITETASEWARQAWPQPFKATADMLTALERIGGHAIGCSQHDLRASELDWTEARAREALDKETRCS